MDKLSVNLIPNVLNGNMQGKSLAGKLNQTMTILASQNS